MIHPSKFCVDFQRNIRKVLILFPGITQRLFQLHMNGVDPEFHVTDTLQTRIKSTPKKKKKERKRDDHLDTRINKIISVF